MQQKIAAIFMLTAALVLLLTGCVVQPVGVADAADAADGADAMTHVTPGVVRTHRMRGDVEVVPGSVAALARHGDSVSVTYDATELVSGNIYTAWWVVINEPGACDGPCPGSEVMGNPDVVLSDLTYADGQIADAEGHAQFRATMHEGELSNPWFGNGLLDATSAEFRLVLHDHGPPIEGMEAEMLSTFRAGCTDESIPAHFPETAFADGTPSDNECIHYQFTIFPSPSDADDADAMTHVTPGTVHTHRLRGDVILVPGAETALMRNDDRITVMFDTSELVPGNIYTLWWVVINKPELCETSPCTGADAMGNPDGVQTTMAYGDGQIAGEAGQATFEATLNEGEIPGNWFGNAFDNAEASEVHVVLHDHGPPIEGLEEEMLSTFRAGCTDESIPAAFPDTAFADGTPGENECIHYQSTIFEPPSDAMQE